METNNKEYEISFSFLMRSLLHHWYVILLSVVVLGAGVFSYGRFFVKPTYSSTVQMFVNNNDQKINGYVTSSEILVAKELVNTYIAILETPDTMSMIIEKANLSYSVSELSAMISTGSVNETEVFFVTVESTDANEAALIADTILEVLPQRISDIVEKSSVRVVQRAQVSTAPSSPNLPLYAIIGAMLGLIGSCLVVILKEMMDQSVREESYLSSRYQARTLAYIPNLNEGASSRRKAIEKTNGELKAKTTDILCDQMPFGAAEAYKMLRANLQTVAPNENAYKVFGMTSANPGDGKSTLMINLAYTVAQTGKKVLLLEADLRKPVLAKRLNLPQRVGLSDLLADADIEAIQDSGYMDNWKVLCAGTSTNIPSELLSSRKMELLIERLRREFDCILIDLPPINSVSDTVAISGCLDGLLCAIKQGDTKKIELEMAMKQLSFSKAEFLGFVFTQAKMGGKYSEYSRYERQHRNYYNS